jgi:hypothetical protein
MRDTAPLAPSHAAPHGPPYAPPHGPVGRARPRFIRPVWAAPTVTATSTTQPAHFLGKCWPRRAASLPADRQLTHRAGVAPSGANCLKPTDRGPWASFPRSTEESRRDSLPDDLPPIRPAQGAACRAPKNTTSPRRHGRSVIPGEAGNVFLIQGHLSPEDQPDRAILRCRSTTAGLAKLPAIAYENELQQPRRPPRIPAPPDHAPNSRAH